MNDAKFLNHHYSFTDPPKTLKRAKLDNLALVPGSLLAHKARWQKFLDQLPEGSRLIILPRTGSSARKTMETVSSTLKAKGCKVTTLTAEHVSSLPTPNQLSLRF